MSTPEDTTTAGVPSAPTPTTTCVCGTEFRPRRVDQVHCSVDCRRTAWRLAHPTFDEMVALPADDLRKVLDRLADARGGTILEDLPASLPSRVAVVLDDLAAVDEWDLRRALRLVAERRFPGRRGRLRVRFGGAGDDPLTEGVC